MTQATSPSSQAGPHRFNTLQCFAQLQHHGCVGVVLPFYLQASLPDLLPALPDGEAAEEDEKIDATRVVRELGLSYTPLERTLTDMARSLVDLGLAVPAGAGGEPVAA